MKYHHAADWARPDASPEPEPGRLSGHSVEDALCQETLKAGSIARSPKRLRSGLTSDCDTAVPAPRPVRPCRSRLTASGSSNEDRPMHLPSVRLHRRPLNFPVPP